MEKLEDKILKKVYRFETRKTATDIIMRILGLLLFFFAFVIFLQAIYDILSQERAFDLLQIFREDSEVVRIYLGDVLYIFFLELPQRIVVIAIVFLALFIVILLTTLRNFRKIRNKIKSLLKVHKNL